MSVQRPLFFTRFNQVLKILKLKFFEISSSVCFYRVKGIFQGRLFIGLAEYFKAFQMLPFEDNRASINFAAPKMENIFWCCILSDYDDPGPGRRDGGGPLCCVLCGGCCAE